MRHLFSVLNVCVCVALSSHASQAQLQQTMESEFGVDTTYTRTTTFFYSEETEGLEYAGTYYELNHFRFNIFFSPSYDYSKKLFGLLVLNQDSIPQHFYNYTEELESGRNNFTGKFEAFSTECYYKNDDNEWIYFANGEVRIGELGTQILLGEEKGLLNYK